MCGIAGIIYRDGAQPHPIGRDMTRMLQSMKHRGPDSTGFALYGQSNGDGHFIMRYTLADANDARDFEFARKYGLPVRVVIQPEGAALDGATMPESYDGPGKTVNSGPFDGLGR